jgi:hypothetical protein
MYLEISEHRIRPLALRQDHKLRVLENKLLMRMFGPRKEEVAGGWRKAAHTTRGFVIYTLLASLNIVRVIESSRVSWAGDKHARETDNAFKIAVGKT